jgi:hypothetical protein
MHDELSPNDQDTDPSRADWRALDDLWRFGLDASQQMTARVTDLYREAGPSVARMMRGDVEGELRQLRLDIERATDLSLDVLERGLELLRWLARDAPIGQQGHGGVTVRATPGGTTHADLWVHNVGLRGGTPPELRCTDLVQFDGSCIDAANVQVVGDASPVGAEQSHRFILVVSVPATAPSGTYRGLVLSSDAETHSIAVCLVVGPAEPHEHNGSRPG